MRFAWQHPKWSSDLWFPQKRSMPELSTVKAGLQESVVMTLFLFLSVCVWREEEEVTMHCHTGKGTDNVLLP